MNGGYIGKILIVDLSSRNLKDENLPDEGILGKFIGGIGLGVSAQNLLHY